MAISDRDLDVINGALTLAIYRAIALDNEEAEEALKDVALRVAGEMQRRVVGPFTLAEARDSGKWYRRIGDLRWRREINGELHCRTGSPGSRPFRDDGAVWVDIADAAAADWETCE